MFDSECAFLFYISTKIKKKNYSIKHQIKLPREDIYINEGSNDVTPPILKSPFG